MFYIKKKIKGVLATHFSNNNKYKILIFYVKITRNDPFTPRVS